MTNESIGITGVIVVTFLLFVLRRLILPSERRRKTAPLTHLARRSDEQFKRRAIEDDAWLLWSPDFESQVDRGEIGEPRAERKATHRYES